MQTGTLLWQPSEDRARQSRMHEFTARCAARYGITPDYRSLHAWSVRQPAAFWQEMFDFAGIRAVRPATSVLSGEGLLGTNWFPGMELNFAGHLLRDDVWLALPGGENRIAIEAQDEFGRTRRVSYAELRETVARLTAALREAGVRRGDRVGAYMPNLPETVMAMLATAALGAIWSSCSPDFGTDGVCDRFGQIEPKLLFTVDGYSYNGKTIDCREKVRAIAERIPSIERIVVAPFMDAAADLRTIPRAVAWKEFATRHSGLSTQHSGLAFEAVPFDHPLYIMYSSGTTGVPKCIVHGHGGTLIQHMKELMLHSDVRAGDTLFYFTTCGWMMWNWLVSGLGVGATLALYEGSPSQPDMHALWSFAQRIGVTHFGTSPRFIAACEKAAIQPGRDHDLGRLRAVLSTGSPLTPDQFAWVYDRVKRDVHLASISGGTDIISCFMLGNPMLPVYAGEIQCRGLGMDVQAFDDSGRSVVGSKGELVCCTPFPSQPVGFWNDPDGEKYRRAYFAHYPATNPPLTKGGQGGVIQAGKGVVWRHGDFVEITEHGGVIVYGRSDATLNPGGVRIGTAEIYREIETLPEIVDSVVVGHNTADADVEVCLFVVLRPGVTLDAELEQRIRTRIAEGATRRHVPRHIRQVSAIPYTRSGKKVEIAVTRMIHGEPVPNREALANPESLAEYAGIV